LGWLLIFIAAAASVGLAWLSWVGDLGALAVGLLGAGGLSYLLGRRVIGATARKRLDVVAKVVFTIIGCMALLRHPIEIDAETRLPIHEAIVRYIEFVDRNTFLLFCGVAMVTKFVGVVASAVAWTLLLRGQGIRFPFWSKIMTAFLIGRFIGTFLPSTLGLDGYTVYEAGRYSNQWSRVITAKFLEKIIGLVGLFLGMTLALPFGYQVLVELVGDRAPLFAAVIGSVAGGFCLIAVTLVFWPALSSVPMKAARWGLEGRRGVPERLSSSILGITQSFAKATAAYRGEWKLLLAVLANKFIGHFTTAVVYFFTALAIGVVGAEFWPIVFGSTIQILATLFSPTIAGEGAREAFQALLLSNQLGGVAPAVLSGALGFVAGEAATLWGGAFLLTRKTGWRPGFAIVDGAQVDYSWLVDDEGGFDVDRIQRARQQSNSERP
jgi:hypothetical protein